MSTRLTFTVDDLRRLDKIRRTRAKMERQERAVKITRAQLHALVRAERHKISQPRLAQAAGITSGRVSQIQADES